MSIRSISLTTSLLLAFTANACAQAGGAPAGLKEAPAPTHCRITDGSARPIQFTNALDLANDPESSYEIVADEARVAQAGVGFALTIAQGDRFVLTPWIDDRLDLLHLRPSARNGNYEEIGRARLVPDGTGLWFRGAALLPAGSAEVGEYVVYKRPDRSSPYNPQPCQRGSGAHCRSAHFEYFDNLDLDVMSHKPVLASELGEHVVMPIQGSACEATHTDGKAVRQSSDGDGDDGPR